MNRILIESSFTRKNSEEERKKIIDDCKMLKRMLDDSRKRLEENSYILEQIVDYPPRIK